MWMSQLTCVVAIALFLVPAPSFASGQVDDNAGTYTDLLRDDADILPASSGLTENLAFDAPGQLVTIAVDPDATPSAFFPTAHATTTTIKPASFSSWGEFLVRYSASEADDVTIVAIDADTGAEFGPFALAASADPDWQGTVDLSAIPATTTELQIRLELETAANGIAPTVQALRVTWTPESVVRVSVTPPETVCSNADMTVRVRTSVSYVDASDLVVWVPLPAATTQPASQSAELRFITATGGGVYHPAGAAPLVIDGQTIPPHSVYWQLGAREAGQTFVLSLSVRAPQGTLQGTTYLFTSHAGLGNGASQVSQGGPASITSSPRPYLNKHVSGTYLIFQQERADEAATLTYTLETGNYPTTPATCGEDYLQAVVVDDVSELVAPTDPAYPAGAGPVFDETLGIHNITHGGQFTATPLTVNGVSVPANSVYWDLDTLDVGERLNLSYSLKLKNSDEADPPGPLSFDQRLPNCAALSSGFATATTGPRCKDVFVGVVQNPSGIYGKGDRIRGVGQVSALANDNRFANANYGDSVGFLLRAANQGASALNDVYVYDKLPEGVTLTSAYVPASSGATLYYHAGGDANDVDDPPDLDATGGFLTGPGQWTSAPPSPISASTWVAMHVPKLASTYFPEAGVPSSVLGELRVDIDVPADACPATTINNRAHFRTYAYTLLGDALPTAIDPPLSSIDSEPIQVVALVPSVERLSVSSSPTTAVGAAVVNYTIHVPNVASGGQTVDTALDVVVEINMPTTLVNGELAPVPLEGVSAIGGAIDYTALPERLVVTYPTIQPLSSRRINVAVRTPQGLIDGSSYSLAAKVTASDDVCGTVTSTSSASTTIRVEPYLEVSKEVNFGIAAPGQPLNYTLTYLNTGDGVSTKTWLVDRLDDGVEFVSVPSSASGEVWFSDQTAPALPDRLDSQVVLDDEAIRAGGLFAPGVLDPASGEIRSPFGAATTWVAFSVDDPDLSPPQLVSGQGRSVEFVVSVRDDTTSGSVASNTAAIVSNEVLPAVGNEVRTTISAQPSLSVLRECATVASAGEEIEYTLAYFNNSTNPNEAVRFVDTLPDALEFVEATHSWNSAYTGDTSIEVTPTVLGQSLNWDVTAATGGALGPLEGGTITVRVRVVPGVSSGTLAEIAGLGSATNAAGNVSFFTACNLFVENADLWLRKSTSFAAPSSGEEVTYTLLLANPGRHSAKDVVITDSLPAGLDYVPGSMFVAPQGWSLAGNGEPEIATSPDGDTTLTWSAANSNGLSSADNPIGYVPGNQSDIFVSYRVTVSDDVPPATTLTNCAAVSSTTAEDAAFANTACVDIRTPKADVYVTKTGPPVAQPGDRVSYRLTYGNLTGQSATDVVLIDALPDGPLPTADGAIDVTLLSASGANGEAIWFADSADAPPTIDANDPAATGWTQDIDSLTTVSHVAVVIGALAGNAGPRSVDVSVALVDPATGLEPQPGSRFENCAVIGADGSPFTDDDDPSNNSGCVTTSTPGIDLSVATVCDPSGSFPGVRVGEPLDVTFRVSNTGTVNAFGVVLSDALADGLDVLGANALTVAMTGPNGEAITPVDINGSPLTQPVPWTRTTAGFLAGSDDASSDVYYRNVGFPPGAQAQLVTNAVVSDSVANGTELISEATVSTDYRTDWETGDPLEELLDNNVASCSTTAYRPDPKLAKAGEPVGGATVPVSPGDRVRWTLTYGNDGDAAADGVVIEDNFPEGAAFVVGSLSGVPDEAVAEYDNGDGSFSYSPVAAAGEPDDAVRAVRVRWLEPLAAPPTAVFEAAGTDAFNAGTFDGTGVRAGAVRVEAVAPSGADNPSYLSAVIPEPGSGAIREWTRLVLSANVPDGEEIVWSLIDPATGGPLEGYESVTPDASGLVDISGIDPFDTPQIQVHARFTGGSGFCGDLSQPPSRLPAPLRPLRLTARGAQGKTIWAYDQSNSNLVYTVDCETGEANELDLGDDLLNGWLPSDPLPSGAMLFNAYRADTRRSMPFILSSPQGVPVLSPLEVPAGAEDAYVSRASRAGHLFGEYEPPDNFRDRIAIWSPDPLGVSGYTLHDTEITGSIRDAGDTAFVSWNFWVNPREHHYHHYDPNDASWESRLCPTVTASRTFECTGITDGGQPFTTASSETVFWRLDPDDDTRMKPYGPVAQTSVSYGAVTGAVFGRKDNVNGFFYFVGDDVVFEALSVGFPGASSVSGALGPNRFLATGTNASGDPTWMVLTPPAAPGGTGEVDMAPFNVGGYLTGRPAADGTVLIADSSDDHVQLYGVRVPVNSGDTWSLTTLDVPVTTGAESSNWSTQRWFATQGIFAGSVISSLDSGDYDQHRFLAFVGPGGDWQIELAANEETTDSWDDGYFSAASTSCLVYASQDVIDGNWVETLTLYSDPSTPMSSTWAEASVEDVLVNQGVSVQAVSHNGEWILGTTQDANYNDSWVVWALDPLVPGGLSYEQLPTELDDITLWPDVLSDSGRGAAGRGRIDGEIQIVMFNKDDNGDWSGRGLPGPGIRMDGDPRWTLDDVLIPENTRDDANVRYYGMYVASGDPTVWTWLAADLSGATGWVSAQPLSGDTLFTSVSGQDALHQVNAARTALTKIDVTPPSGMTDRIADGLHLLYGSTEAPTLRFQPAAGSPWQVVPLMDADERLTSADISSDRSITGQLDDGTAVYFEFTAPATWTRHDLPTVPDASTNGAVASNAGIVAQVLRIDDVSHVVVWERDGSGDWQAHVIPSLDDMANLSVYGINEGGIIYGYASGETFGGELWLKDPNTGTWQAAGLPAMFPGASIYTPPLPDPYYFQGYDGQDSGIWTVDPGGDPQVTFRYFGEFGLSYIEEVIGGAVIAESATNYQDAFLWGCGGGPAATIDSIRASYLTDGDPQITLDTEVRDVCTASHVNQAVLTTDTPEVDDTNNSSSASVGVNTTDVSVELGVDRATASLGDVLTYTATVTNAGPGVATNVEMTITPASNTDGQQTSFVFGSLPAGVSLSREVTATVTTDMPNLSLAAGASVSTPSIDCDAGNDTATAITLTGSWPNLYVTIDADDVVKVGDAFYYLITYGNDGNDVVTAPLVTLTLPTGAMFADATTTPTSTGSTVTWQLADLEPEDTGEILVELAAPNCNGVGDELLATVSGETSADETTVTDNADADTTTVLAPPGAVAARLVPRSARFVPGEPVWFDVVVDNVGSATLTDVVVEVPGINAAQVVGATTGATYAPSLTWQLSELAVGGFATFTFALTPTGSDALVVDMVTTAAGACAPASDTQMVAAATPGLEIVKTASTGTSCPSVDGSVTWRVVVRNTSDQPLSDVSVSDTVPPELAYLAQSMVGPGADDSAAPELAWNLGDLAPGAVLTLSYETLAPASQGAFVATSASATSADGSVTSAPATLRSSCSAGLALTKAWTADCTLGGEAVVTLRVDNRSGETATGIVVVDDIPAGVDFVGSASGTETASGDIRFDVGQLSPGASRTLAYTVSISAALPSGAFFAGHGYVSADNAAPQVSNSLTGAKLSCADDQACTTDGCSPAVGCVFLPVPDGTTCDDGRECSLADACVAGACVGAEITCDDDGNCTVLGPDGPEAPSDFPCNDDNACTLDLCNDAGQCTNTDVSADCDDGDPCTVDVCDEAVGCQNTPLESIGEACDGDDDDLCTEGVWLCDGETGALSCSETGDGNVETCNGEDDDCDGLVDADDPSMAAVLCDNQDGVCSGATRPTSLCVGGEWEPCDEGVYSGHAFPNFAAVDDSCDGLDNSCSGAVDDDWEPTLVTCGVGACAGNQALTICSEGAELDLCDPLSGATPEICNGIDDDCDGSVDIDGLGEALCPEVDTVITSAPDSITSATTVTLTFEDPLNPEATAFECSLDGGDWVPCDGGSVTYDDLGDGSHTLLVRAVGADGQPDATPAFATWVVDTTTPDTLAVSCPDDPSQSSSAQVSVSSNAEGAVSYFCAIDPATEPPAPEDYVACEATSSYEDLSEGEHVIYVYVVSAAGVADPEPLVCRWTVDTVLPETAFVDGPTGATSETTVTATYHDPTDEDVTEFVCRLDDGDWFECDGGSVVLEDLDEGEHTLAVASVDGSGNQDPTPATRTWTVDTTAPDTFIPTHPDDPSQSGSGTFGFASTEEGVVYYCVIDPALDENGVVAADAYALCDPTYPFEGLADGEHTVWVYAVDDAGNADDSPATYTWTQDATDPETAITDGPPSATSVGEDVTISFEDPTDPDLSTFECRLDGGEWFPCDGGSTTLSESDLPEGEHTFDVRACDALTGCDPTPATITWTVSLSPCPLDDAAPDITCLPSQVVECVAGSAEVQFSELAPTASDSCEPVEVAWANETALGLGTTPVVYTATDGNGNVSSCVTEVTVSDTEAPIISCDDTLVAVSTDPGSCTAQLALTQPSAEDACYGESVIVSSDAPALFPVGSSTVTYQALDGAGNSAACSVEVVVTDDEPIQLVCDEAFQVEAAADACSWTGSVSATATDNCAVDATVIEEASTYAVGTTEVLFRAEDDAGNEATCATQVVVVDVTPPTVTCGEVLPGVPAIAVPQTEDACGADVTVASVTCWRRVDGSETELLPADCPARPSDDLSQLEVTGRIDAGLLVVRYVVEAVDAAGNVSSIDCSLEYDADADGDGILEPDDNCPTTANPSQTDGDGDGIGDACDVCPSVSDADQLDTDGNGIGDACQDLDGDSVLDAVDNCPADANPGQLDLDLDGLGDLCDAAPHDGLAASGGACAQAGGGWGPLFVALALLMLVWRRRESRDVA